MKYEPRGIRLSATNQGFMQGNSQSADSGINKETYPIDELIKIAIGEIGNHEEGGNNRGANIVKYQKATWLAPDAWPWCAAFIDWCIMIWQARCPKMPHFERPQTAGAFDLENWGKKQGFKILPEIALSKAGDIIIFDFSHVGLVIEDQDGDYIKTIEGNTNGSGARDSIAGDGVWRKIRHRSLAKCFIRFEK